MAPYIINIVLLALVFAAVSSDIRSRRIPNWQTIPAVGLGIALNFIYAGHNGLLASLGGGLFGAALLAIPYLFGGMGAGDVKLLMAIGALKGWPFTLWTAGYAALIGGLAGIIIVVKRRAILRLLLYLLNPLMSSGLPAYLPLPFTARLTFQKEEKPESLSVRLPYGLAIGLATVVALYLQYWH